MTILSTIIFLSLCSSQLLAQTTLSQQQLFAGTSDFMFSAEQMPITIDYVVEIQTFSSIQIDQLSDAIESITNTNHYELAVTNVDGTQKDLPLKTMHLNLLRLTKYFTSTLRAFNKYLDSHRDIKNDFKFGSFACNISQDYSHKDIPNYSLEVMRDYQENFIAIDNASIKDQNSNPHKKLKMSIIHVLDKLHSISEEYERLFEQYFDLLNNIIIGALVNLRRQRSHDKLL